MAQPGTEPTYCMNCGHMLVPNIYEYNLHYCGNSDCPRYGLYTGLVDTEKDKKKMEDHKKSLNLKKS